MKSKKTSKESLKPAEIKCFFIVGNCAARTEGFVQILETAVSVAGHLADVSPDFERLQEQAFETDAMNADLAKEMDTLFELNNQKFDAWYWLPKKPDQVVKHWKAFNNKTRFIIVYTSPVDALNAATQELGHLLTDVEKLLGKWREDTERLIHLFESIPDRCVIVSADTPAVTQLSFGNLKRKLQLAFDQPLPASEGALKRTSDRLENYIINEQQIAQLHHQFYQSMLFDTPSSGVKRSVTASNQRTSRPAGDGGFSPEQVYDDDYSGIGQELLELQDENRELTQKLHSVQEQYEQKLVINREHLSQINAQRLALQKIYNAFPEYWNIEAVSVKFSDHDGASSEVEIQLLNAEVDYTIVEEIKIKLSLSPDMPSVSIKPTPSTWLSYLGSTAVDWLTIAPRQGAIFQGSNAVISLLGPTDWKSIQELLKKLCSYVGSSLHKHQFAPKAKQISQALSMLCESLRAWPTVPRYDKITLKDTLQQGHYRSLGILISNLEIGTSKWGKLFYRLATLDESGVTFGTNPRLEFPQESKSALQNWFGETEDGRGQRLELRFAKPDAMDLQVWSALAESDKLLIAGLISSLGNQLNDLERTSELVKTDWNEWQILARSIRQIAAKKITT
ncbi:MAG TPA: hypothetical protein VF682_10780 [Pseudomonas sp.]|jgi:hypothetical protein